MERFESVFGQSFWELFCTCIRQQLDRPNDANIWASALESWRGIIASWDDELTRLTNFKNRGYWPRQNSYDAEHGRIEAAKRQLIAYRTRFTPQLEIRAKGEGDPPSCPLEWLVLNLQSLRRVKFLVAAVRKLSGVESVGDLHVFELSDGPPSPSLEPGKLIPHPMNFCGGTESGPFAASLQSAFRAAWGQSKRTGLPASVVYRWLGYAKRPNQISPESALYGDSASGAFAFALLRFFTNKPYDARILVMAAIRETEGQSVNGEVAVAYTLERVDGVSAKIRAALAFNELVAKQKVSFNFRQKIDTIALTAANAEEAFRAIKTTDTIRLWHLGPDGAARLTPLNLPRMNP